MDKRKTLLLLLAPIPACMIAFAQQQPAFHFDAQVWPNAVIGGYAFDSSTRIDTIALSDSGAVAFTAHRDNSGNGRDQTAVLTKDRLVAYEGQVIDGKIIVRIATSVLGVNNANRVAFEALYLEPGHNELHGGVFVEDRLATEFEPSPNQKATGFLLADDGMIRLTDGIIGPKPRKSWITASLLQSVHQFQYALIRRIPRGSYPDLWGQGVNVADTVAWDTLNRSKSPKRSQKAPPSEARTCPAPNFPVPSDWSIGSISAGPVAAKLFEPVNPARSYDSPIYGHITAPFRQVQFDHNCAPQVVTVGDDKGRLEARTPRGLLTYEKPDGTLALPGFFQNAVAGSFIASDVSFAINAKGQIAIRIVVDGGGAVLLATPVLVKP